MNPQRKPRERETNLLLERGSVRAAADAYTKSDVASEHKPRRGSHRDQMWWFMMTAFALLAVSFVFVLWASRQTG